MTNMADAPTKIIPPTHPDKNAIVDSVTTAHFTQATSVWINRKLTKYPISVTLSDGSWIILTHTAMLSLQNLSESARLEHIFPELKVVDPLCVSQIFDQGCTVNFTSYQVSVTLEKQTTLKCPRENSTGLWTFPMTNTSLTQLKPWVPPPTTWKYTHAIQTIHPPAVIYQAANNTFATEKRS